MEDLWIPLDYTTVSTPNESQPQAHNLEVMEKFPIEFYKTTELMPKASDVKSVTMVKDRLGKREMFYGYDFTHDTSVLFGELHPPNPVLHMQLLHRYLPS